MSNISFSTFSEKYRTLVASGRYAVMSADNLTMPSMWKMVCSTDSGEFVLRSDKTNEERTFQHFDTGYAENAMLAVRMNALRRDPRIAEIPLMQGEVVAASVMNIPKGLRLMTDEEYMTKGTNRPLTSLKIDTSALSLV